MNRLDKLEERILILELGRGTCLHKENIKLKKETGIEHT